MLSIPAVSPSGERGRRLYYSADGRIVVAEMRVSALVDSALRLFPEYEVPNPGRSVSDQVDVALGSASRGFVVTSRDLPDVICGTSVEAVAAFEFALSCALASSFSKNVHLHASGVVVNGQAILVFGGSGAGKSSLAIAVMSRGHPTLGDDIVLLDSSARAAPFKRLLKVNPAVLNELGIDPADTVQWDPDWPEAWYEPREGPGWADEVPVAVIVSARYDRNASLRLCPISAAEALNVALHSVLPTGMSAGEAFDSLLRMVQGAQAFCLEFPSAIEAAEALCDLTN